MIPQDNNQQTDEDGVACTSCPAGLISILVCISFISRQSGVVSDAGSAIIGCDHQITRRPAWYRWVGGWRVGGPGAAGGESEAVQWRHFVIHSRHPSISHQKYQMSVIHHLGIICRDQRNDQGTVFNIERNTFQHTITTKKYYHLAF